VRGSTLKSHLLLGLFHAGRALPAWLIDLLVRALAAVLRLGYRLPGNPLRAGCRNLAALAGAAGHPQPAAAIHRRLVGQVSLVLRAFVRIFKQGRDAALADLPVDPAVGARVAELLDAHGGLIVAVPHNACSLLSSIGLPADRVVVVVRNREGRHNRVSRAVIEQMRIATLEVRNLSPIALSRAMLGALAGGKALICTVDGNYRKPDAVPIEIFGHPKGFGPWAAKIAAKRGVPILPCYPRAEAGVVTAWLGEPLADRDPVALMRHYVAFFEACILRDPGSWAFLADKRWRRHIAK
jgi:lauroyl/myristoyl acyltransferase